MTDAATLAKEILEGKGYVVLPSLLSAAEAQEARSIILQLAPKYRNLDKLSLVGQKERVFGLIYQGEVFELMVQHPRVMEVIEAILGNSMTLSGFSAHILYTSAKTMGMHVDYPYWAIKKPFPAYPVLGVQVLWMVQDFTHDNGAPIFLPASQKLYGKLDLSQLETLGQQKITGKAGSVIIFHSLCRHDTSVNATEVPRVSILGNYIPKYLHPQEDFLYNFRQEVIDRASDKFKHLIRYNLKPASEPVFKL